MSALVDKWNSYKNALRDLLTKPEGTVDMEDGTGTIVTLPTYPQLEKNVSELVDEASGAVAGAQASASAALSSANASASSADESAASAASAAQSSDAANASAAAAKDSETAAAASASEASASADAASSSASSAASSAEDSEGSAVRAKNQADSSAASASASNASKDAAAASADLADQFANAPVNTEVEPGKFSAFHWSEQARLISAGAMIFKGKFDASSGTYPPSPNRGDLYLVGTEGAIGDITYAVGDLMFFDGDAWDRIDNQQTVTSVAGRTGAVTLSKGDIAGLQDALDGKLSTSGGEVTGEVSFDIRPTFASYTPWDTGNLANPARVTSPNSIKFDWSQSNSGQITVTVDVTQMGYLWHSGNFNPNNYAALGNNPTFTGGSVSCINKNTNSEAHYMLGSGGLPKYYIYSNGSGSDPTLGLARCDASTGSYAESLFTYSHGSGRFTFNVPCSAPDFSATSDERLKSDHAPLSRGIAALRLMPPHEYTKAGRREIGYFANEAREVIPEAVSEGQDGYLLLSYGQVTALIGSAVLELADRLEALEAR